MRDQEREEDWEFTIIVIIIVIYIYNTYLEEFLTTFLSCLLVSVILTARCV